MLSLGLAAIRPTLDDESKVPCLPLVVAQPTKFVCNQAEPFLRPASLAHRKSLPEIFYHKLSTKNDVRSAIASLEGVPATDTQQRHRPNRLWNSGHRATI